MIKLAAKYSPHCADGKTEVKSSERRVIMEPENTGPPPDSGVSAALD